MIKLNIDINLDDILPNKEKYDQDVSNSLKEIADLVPAHTSDEFKNKLWGVFKHSIWEQQGQKCAFCEKEIISSDDGQVEHFRPKTETRDEQNKQITRYAYWWLAYDHKNYVVSCSTCNKLKGNRFPLIDEDTRVTASSIDEIIALTDKGVLGDERPYLINPRFQYPEIYLAYNYRPDTKIVFAEPKDDDGVGEKTIKILDLNRERKNEEIEKDNLPHKRGSVLSEFKNELDRFNVLKKNLNNYRVTLIKRPGIEDLKKLVDENESVINKKRENIRERFLAKNAQFSGMCTYWLRYDTDLEDDFIVVAA